MAVEWISWALEQDLSTGCKFVLVALSNRANEDGECWPSQSDLAKQTSQSKRSIINHLQALEEKGYLKRETRHRDNGSRRSDKYILTKVQNLHSGSENCNNISQGANISPSKVQPFQGGGENSAPLEPSIEPKKKKINKKEKYPDWWKAAHQELWDEYKNHRKEKNKKLTPTAESRALKKLTRLRDQGHDPELVITQSLESNWDGLFELKNKQQIKPKQMTMEDVYAECGIQHIAT